MINLPLLGLLSSYISNFTDNQNSKFVLFKTKPPTLWVRPLTMFTEKVVVDGKLVDRFSFQKTSIEN
jgi:hypothetical protein